MASPSCAYLLAAIFSERIYSRSELRKVFEEDQIAFSDLAPRYQNNLKLVKQGRQIDRVAKPAEPDTRLQTIETATETLRLRLDPFGENSPLSEANLVVCKDAPIFTSDFRCETTADSPGRLAPAAREAFLAHGQRVALGDLPVELDHIEGPP